MQNYLPQKLTLPTKFNIFNLHHQRIQTLIIDKHTQAIKKFFEEEKPPLFIKLSTESFWDELKTKAPAPVEELHQTWLKLMPLAHLSSKQLIQLYQNHVISLERCYQYLVAQFPEEEIKRQLMENLQCILLLKQHIFDGLYFRAKIYQTLHSARNVDDVLAVFGSKLNALGSDLTLLTKPLQATLNDDRRLFIFDLLKLHDFNEIDLHDTLLSPIPKRLHGTFKNKTQIKYDLEKFNTYRNGVLHVLHLAGIGEYVFSISYQRAELKRMGIALWENMKIKFNAWRALAFWEQIRKIRFLIYLVLSFGMAQLLERMITPLAFPLLSGNAAIWISSLLFYGVALAPIGWQGIQMLRQLCGWVQDYVTCWKKREILDALIVLEDTEHFLCEKLSHTVVDLCHFDTEELNQRVAEVIRNLDKTKMQLARYAPGEKWACAGIAHEARKAISKIILLKGTLKKRLSLLASHIALRAGEEIGLLERSLDKEQMHPPISRKQLNQLAYFVHHSGDKTAWRLFAENTNITARWLERVKTDQFLFQNKKHPLDKQQPWGGYQVRKDALKGWEMMLNAFVRDPIENESVIKLHHCLLGKAHLSEAELRRVFSYLSRDQSLLEGIQAFLFKTLPERPPECAALLSTAQKDLIATWHLAHLKEINEASHRINKLFCNGRLSLQQLDIFLREVRDKELCHYFSLLDGEAFYSHSVGKESQRTRNLVRVFFEDYDGSNSDAYRLINFIPQNKQVTWLVRFAEKRLSWLLVQTIDGTPSAFTENDIALFHNRDLYQQFHFSDFVQQSPCFNAPWSKKMEQFLSSCQAYGFDTGELAAQYSQKKPRKAFFFKREASCNKEKVIKFKTKRKPGYA